MSEQDSARRFGGVERLYGKESLERFTQSHIVVIGIGGVGSWVAEALARNAIGKLTLIDLDVVAESNINRQLPALSNTIGHNKIEVMAERIKQINADCEVILIDDFISLDNFAELIPIDAHFIVDCIDSSKIKAGLIAWCKRKKLKILTVGGAGGQLDPMLIKTADLSNTKHDPLLSRTRKILRQKHGFSTNLKRRFSIPCVYSTEHLQRPQTKESKATDLSCAGGIGSSVMVTGSFAFIACAYILNQL